MSGSNVFVPSKVIAVIPTKEIVQNYILQYLLPKNYESLQSNDENSSAKNLHGSRNWHVGCKSTKFRMTFHRDYSPVQKLFYKLVKSQNYKE